MSIRTEDPRRAHSTARSRHANVDVTVLLARLCFVVPLIPVIAYLIGAGTVEGLGSWLTEASGLVWIGGFILLIILEVVSWARHSVKRGTTED